MFASLQPPLHFPSPPPPPPAPPPRPHKASITVTPSQPQLCWTLKEPGPRTLIVVWAGGPGAVPARDWLPLARTCPPAPRAGWLANKPRALRTCLYYNSLSSLWCMYSLRGRRSFRSELTHFNALGLDRGRCWISSRFRRGCLVSGRYSISRGWVLPAAVLAT